MPAPPPADPRRYDVCFSLPGGSLFRKLDRGVALGGDGIAWTTDGRTLQMPYGDVAAVHLTSGGLQTIIDRCAIAFADGTALTVVNSNPGGYADRAQAAAYRDFVHDLHRRLAAGAAAGTRFTAGGPRGRYLTMMAATGVVTLACVAGGAAFFVVFGDLKGIALAFLGAYLGWKFGRVTRANAPRDYAPGHVPEELLR